MQVQSRLLLTERLELQTLRDTLTEAREEEEKAISLLNQDSSQMIPPGILVRRAVSSAAKIKSFENLLEAQVEKTLDHARREQLVKKKLDSANESLSRHEFEYRTSDGDRCIPELKPEARIIGYVMRRISSVFLASLN